MVAAGVEGRDGRHKLELCGRSQRGFSTEELGVTGGSQKVLAGGLLSERIANSQLVGSIERTVG